LKLNYNNVSTSKLCLENSTEFSNWLATIHKVIETYVCELFKAHIPYNTGVVYSGGGAQNTVYNERLSHMYKNLVIPPHCYDGGISLGCVKLLSMITGEKLMFSEFPFGQDTYDTGYAADTTIEQVVELLDAGKIVGWCQGKGEIGPRALGHRSILLNPMVRDGKECLNQRIKKREYWRPYAASVRRNNIYELTGQNKDFPFMLNAISVKREYHESLSSVIHIDGTCRFQTVEDIGTLQTYYKLLDMFEQKSGCLGILNTSLNIGGKPIVSSFDDAMELYNDIDIDAICIGNKLYVK
jgi:carbamoyltransferase